MGSTVGNTQRFAAVLWHYAPVPENPHLDILVNGRFFQADDGVKELMTGGEIACLVGIAADRASVRFDAEIDQKDLRLNTFCPSGRSMNAPHTAVRITHIPSGVVVTSQEEDSPFKNRAKAIRAMRTKLYESGVLTQREIGPSEEVRIENGAHFLVQPR